MALCTANWRGPWMNYKLKYMLGFAGLGVFFVAGMVLAAGLLAY